MFSNLSMITRKQWEARDPKSRKKLEFPVKKIIIHKSNSKECWSKTACGYFVKKLQKFHMRKDKKVDIKYNFIVAANEMIYEGRGWQYQGEHCAGLDDQSIGIAFLMKYSDRPPDEKELQLVKDIIMYGIKKGYIAKDFEVIPHGDLTDETICPGIVILDELINFAKKLKREQSK